MEPTPHLSGVIQMLNLILILIVPQAGQLLLQRGHSPIDVFVSSELLDELIPVILDMEILIRPKYVIETALLDLI